VRGLELQHAPDELLITKHQVGTSRVAATVHDAACPDASTVREPHLPGGDGARGRIEEHVVAEGIAEHAVQARRRERVVLRADPPREPGEADLVAVPDMLDEGRHPRVLRIAEIVCVKRPGMIAAEVSGLLDQHHAQLRPRRAQPVSDEAVCEPSSDQSEVDFHAIFHSMFVFRLMPPGSRVHHYPSVAGKRSNLRYVARCSGLA